MTTMTTDGSAPNPVPAPAEPGAYTVLTVLMLMFGGFVLPVVGWLAGVVMLWTGAAWTTGEKWLGTLVWPAVVVVPVAPLAVAGLMRGAGTGVVPLHILAVVLGAVMVLGVLPWTFVKLLRAGRR